MWVYEHKHKYQVIIMSLKLLFISIIILLAGPYSAFKSISYFWPSSNIPKRSTLLIIILNFYNIILNKNGASTLPIGFRQDRNDFADPILRTSVWILARSSLKLLLGVKTQESNNHLIKTWTTSPQYYLQSPWIKPISFYLHYSKYQTIQISLHKHTICSIL